MGCVVAIANQKGGVGKTTTAINLGAALAEGGRRVLLVDCDPQGNASSGLGRRVTLEESSLHDILLDGAPMRPEMPFPELPLHLVPSGPKLAAAEWRLIGRKGSETTLAATLRPLKSSFDDILLDAPPSLGLLTINTLCAADEVIIPLQCEYFAMEGLSLLLETIRKVKLRWNPKLRILGVLPTMFDGRNKLSHQVVHELRTHFRHRVFETVIPRNVRLGECPSHGLPVILYDAKCRGSQAYQRLAMEILHRRNGYER